MKRLITAAVENSMVVDLFAAVVLIAGLYVASHMQRESFPTVTMDIINVSVALPGASAEEVEEGVTIKIEEAVDGVAGIDYVTSLSVESMGTVNLVLRSDVADSRSVLDEVKDKVNQIFTFPEDAEEPKISLEQHWEPSITVIVSGDMDELSLKSLGEEIRDEMLLLPDVSKVDEVGVRDREISIEVSEDSLRRYGLTFNEVAQAVRNYDFDVSGGVLRSNKEELSLRAVGRNYRPEGVEKITLRALPDGTTILLRDVAAVKEDFEEINYRLRYDGQPAMFLNVMKTEEEDTIKVTDAVKKYMVQKAETLPPSVHLNSWWDRSKFLRQRLDLLVRNAKIGLVLIFVSLLLFLGFRISWWVAFGMPVSVMGTLLLLNWYGVTINMISLFAFLLVLGILVDDGIVVAEMVQQKIENGENPKDAAINGTSEVFPAVFASVTTTMVAFAPFFFVKGIWGAFLFAIPVIVIFSLACSIVESAFILPTHLAHSLLPIEEQRKGRGPHWAVRRFLDKCIYILIQRTYRPALKLALKLRWAGFAAGLGLFILAIAQVKAGLLEFVFFPDIESDFMTATYVLEPGSSIDVQEKVIQHLEKQLGVINSEFTKERTALLRTPKGEKFAEGAGPEEPVIQKVVSTIGGSSGRGMGEGGQKGAEIGEVTVELIDGEYRGVDVKKMVNRWRELIGDPPGVVRMKVDAAIGMGGGAPIVVKLMGKEMDQLIQAANLVKARLGTYAGVYDVQDDLAVGRREIVLGLNDKGKALGLTLRDLATQVRSGFYGLEVHRVQRGRDEIKVWVRYPKQDRKDISDLEKIMIRTPSGAEVPLLDVAVQKERRQFRAIQRWDRRRSLTVTCNVDTDKTVPDSVKAELSKDLPAVLAQVEDVSFQFEGEERDRAQMMGSLAVAFPIALFVIFVIISLTFKNYLHALLIMMIIPLGFVGAVVGHRVVGIQLTILSIWGIVGLAGIVVNDSIVLIDAVKRNIAKGMELFPAVLEGAVSRFRAIILTTLTTAAGMMPIIMEKSLQAKFLIPMATSVSFGLVVGTFFTLVWLPCAFMVLNGIKIPWYIMATGRFYRPIDIERNALPDGQFVKGVIPAWLIGLIVLCGIGIMMAVYWGIGPYMIFAT